MNRDNNDRTARLLAAAASLITGCFIALVLWAWQPAAAGLVVAVLFAVDWKYPGDN